ncbi:hypothetical protein COEREDRAFT_88897 [Coemansia reversa NRRL 1564]|uniref:Uncharacterized protein n=1 Tax=Coemansia reversa (strain ATCC 12441 / NRRL 1564) TaxID=763665 RepID=A0A2G5B5D4_COERN|nr:hypothetical protein COEREDRAFT_88897 [Coemansia reversa NRRL 1564]|eukprot:PIA14228.1 hypothetical protein COEREDRAFT_88897 [Coemansia reversa NRRL 1564]
MYTKYWRALITITLCAVAKAFDFHTDEAAKCAHDHWDDIRKIVNPKISMMESILPESGIEKVKSLLDGKTELPKDPPSRNWLSDAADAIPEPLMNMFGKDIIEKCVKEAKHE